MSCSARSWVIVYNADVLLGAMTQRRSVGSARWLPSCAVDRVSAAEPLPHRHDARDVHARRLHARRRRDDLRLVHAAFDNDETFGGGFDVRAASAGDQPDRRPPRGDRDRAGPRASDFRVVSAQSYLPVKARQTGKYAVDFATYPVRGVDAAFSAHDVPASPPTPAVQLDRELAGAAKDPGLAIVDGWWCRGADNWSAGGAARLPTARVLPRGPGLRPGPDRGARPADEDDSPAEGDRRAVRPGAARDGRDHDLPGHARNAFRRPRADDGLLLRPRTGVDPRAEARKLESAFLAYGLQAHSLDKLLEDAVATSWTFNRLIQDSWVSA